MAAGALCARPQPRTGWSAGGLPAANQHVATAGGTAKERHAGNEVTTRIFRRVRSGNTLAAAGSAGRAAERGGQVADTSSTAGSCLGIRLLGPVEVTVGGAPRAIPKLTHRILLAILVSADGRVVPASALVEELWQEDASPRRRKNLQTHVYQLRRVLHGLEPDCAAGRIVTRPPGYQLTIADCELDLHALDELVTAARQAARQGDRAQARGLYQRALALWRGPALADVRSCSPVLGGLAERLEQRRIAILEERIDIDLAAGLHADLVPELTGLIAEHPLRERLRARLMLSLYRSGRAADALAAYQDARNVLLDELGLDPSAELQDLHTRILNGDTGIAAAEPATHDTANAAPGTQARSQGAVGVFRQLPAALGTFTGREAELDRLLAVTSQDTGTVVICTVEGMAGIGKTQLALRAAHLLVEAGRHAELQLFVNLRGFDKDRPPADPAVVLESFLLQLGVPPQQVPGTLEDRAAMFRDRIYGRDALIVLDNAAGEAQVRPLIPGGPGCLVLITSRRGLSALDNAVVVMLDVLTDAEAIALLARIAGGDRVAAEPEAATRIAALCGGLPLAVSLAAARLRSRPAWRLADLAERLGRGLEEIVSGGKDLTTVFGLSYRGLPAAARRVFLLLGLDPGADVTAASVSALADLTLTEADQALELLQDEYLVQQRTPGRFELHDLLRGYAAGLAAAQLSEAERMAAIEAVIAWYTATAVTASEAVSNVYPGLPGQAWLPGHKVRFSNGAEAMRWYEHERVNLLRAAECAVRLTLHEPAWLLSVALGRLEGVAENWPEVERLMSAALPFARRAQRPGRASTAEVIRHLAFALRETGRHEEAITVLKQALATCRELGDRDEEARVLGFVVFSYAAAGRPETGLEHGIAGLAAFSDDEKAETGGLLNATAACLIQLDRPAEALGYLHAYVGMCRSLGAQRALALALRNTGYAYSVLERHTDAEAVLEEAAAIAKTAGDRLVHADSLNGIARALHGRGQVPQAWLRHRQAMAILDDLPDADAARLRAQLGASPLAFPVEAKSLTAYRTRRG